MTDPFIILLMGMIVVVDSIIGLRLHAIVALLLGAIVVALITPETAIEQFFLETGSSLWFNLILKLINNSKLL